MTLTTQKYQALQQHIDQYWEKLKVTDTLENRMALGLPCPYYAPSLEYVEGFAFPNMFYWDTYFICEGLWGTDRQEEIAGMADNFFDLINRLGYIPNSNSFQHLSRSQPPLSSRMVRKIIERTKRGQNEKWMWHAYAMLTEEYNMVWLGTQQPHIRNVFRGLSRYYDANALHSLAEAESGWDYTTRFDDRCLDFLPIDLNSLLYGFENDLAFLAERLGREDAKKEWLHKAEVRQSVVNELMWDEKQGFYFDYDFRREELPENWSLAGFFPMYVGLANEHQAERMMDNLEKFETPHGLTVTHKDDPPHEQKQWSTPNGWAPMHDVVSSALDRYGYHEEARRIRQKWVDTVLYIYERDGELFEKYNMVNMDTPVGNGVYPNQHGFGWTNGITAKFLRGME